jgi:hypothetical protein
MPSGVGCTGTLLRIDWASKADMHALKYNTFKKQQQQPQQQQREGHTWLAGQGHFGKG